METPHIGKKPVHLGLSVPPSGGSLEIGNLFSRFAGFLCFTVPPSGGSLEIGNEDGSLAINDSLCTLFPLRGDP